MDKRKKKKKKAKKKKGRKIGQREKEKNLGKDEEMGRKEKIDFPSVPTVKSRRSES